MADGFAEMIDRSNVFFSELAQNNRRDWFEPRKATYEAEIRKPALLMADLLAEDFARLTDKPHAPKVFRIYRDVRFSKDKRPYNAHLHMIWRPPSPDTAPAWFFGTAPDYVTMGMGTPGLAGPALTGFRAFLDTEGDTLAGALDEASATAGVTLSSWGPAPLKRVPKPYPPDHPRADLLRRKGFTVERPLDADWRAMGHLPTNQGGAQTHLPLRRELDRALG